MKRGLSKPAAVLSVAGSDSGGGAGVQMDLKVLARLGLHGTCAITAVTAQNPSGIAEVSVLTPRLVRRQIETVLGYYDVKSVKAGITGSAGIIRAVVETIPADVPLVVDPVLGSTSGTSFAGPGLIREMERSLFPRATLLTPNRGEAERLSGEGIRTPEDARAVARLLAERYGCGVLVKGGHLEAVREAVDVLAGSGEEWLFTIPRVFHGAAWHGAGCFLSTAIAGWLALKFSLPEAVRRGKTMLARSMARSVAPDLVP